MLKETLDKSYPEMFELYDKVIDLEYVRKKTYMSRSMQSSFRIEENEELQQLAEDLFSKAKQI